MRGPGQIAELTAIAEPDVGVITAVAPVHLELLGSIEAIAAAKAELVAGLRPGGTAIVPGGRAAARRPSPRRRHDGDLRPGGDVDALPEGLELSVRRSAHMRRNALAALAAARALGVEPDGLIDVALSSCAASGSSSPGGIVVVNDCYNANPMSMRAALDDLAASASGRRVAVLGDMLELGPDEVRFHAEIGAHARAAASTCSSPSARAPRTWPTATATVIALPDAAGGGRRGPRPAASPATPSWSRPRAASASRPSPGRWKAPDGRGPHRGHGRAAHLHLPVAALHRASCATASSASTSARRGPRATTRRPARRRWAGSSSSLAISVPFLILSDYDWRSVGVYGGGDGLRAAGLRRRLHEDRQAPLAGPARAHQAAA